jgi:hypothetical protein
MGPYVVVFVLENFRKVIAVVSKQGALRDKPLKARIKVVPIAANTPYLKRV